MSWQDRSWYLVFILRVKYFKGFTFRPIVHQEKKITEHLRILDIRLYSHIEYSRLSTERIEWIKINQDNEICRSPRQQRTDRKRPFVDYVAFLEETVYRFSWLNRPSRSRCQRPRMFVFAREGHARSHDAARRR